MLDHLVYFVPDLEAGIRDFEARSGVRASIGGKHEGAGSHNALLSLGNGAYLELIAPDAEQVLPPGTALPFGIHDLTAPKLVTWMARPVDIERQVAQARAAGYHLSSPYAMQRRRPDGSSVAWRIAMPREIREGGLLPGLIEWHTQQHPSTTGAAGCSLVSLYGLHLQPEMVRELLASFGLELEVRAGEPAGLVAVLATPKGEIELR